MLGLLGKKLGMTTLFTSDGKAIPATVILAGPCKIVQIKTNETDGYCALQLGFDFIPKRKVNKPMLGHFRKAGLQETPARKLTEFRIDDENIDPNQYKLGQTLSITDVFREGMKVDCTGKSKGRGFQGVVKRHHFGGGPKTHGQSDRLRAPGSIGASSFPSHVWKGMRMAGHMGNEKVTVKALEVLKIFPEKNLMVIKGAIPGPKGGYIIIRRSKKGGQK